MVRPVGTLLVEGFYFFLLKVKRVLWIGSSVVFVGSVLLKDFCSKNRLFCTRIYKSLLQQCDVQKRKVEQVEDDCEMENEGVRQLFRLITSEQKQN